MKPQFFTPKEFRKWLEKNHDKETEIHIGYYKKGTGKENMTWPESVEQALCFGWIDGVRRSIDDEAYTIRFTKRKPNSIWSNINIAHVERLTKLGLMQPAGLKVFEARKPEKSGIYSFEKPDNKGLSEESLVLVKKNKKAWVWFSKQAPSFQKTAGHWVESAKQQATRDKRLTELIANAAKGEPPSPYKYSTIKTKK
jgi:uncharacterized protein YdeI (YjbR/CyaY-like superfamily)